MPVAERAASTRAGGQQRSLCGWGRTSPCRSLLFRPGDREEALELLATGAGSRAGLIARGAGRSYGDAAQLAGGEVLDTTALNRIRALDAHARTVTVEAGVTVAQLMARLAADGLTLPVVPGTRFVTIAGAIASDIHGKNHHHDGGFARHVLDLSLWTPAGGLVEVSPQSDPELFYGTLGGMGLTGVILQATLRVEPLATPWVSANVDRTDGLEQTLALLAAPEQHRYSVAWLDLLARGASAGRAVISRADPLPSAPAAGRRRHAMANPAALARGPRLDVPRATPAGLLRPAAVRAFNALRWRTSPRRVRERPVALAPYFFPLDALGAWNRLYGPAGLLQYQFVIPSGEEAELWRCFELIRARRLPVYLAVFKRFGAAHGGPLSFPLEGWTLAIDLPAAAPGLRPALHALDEIVAGCGGRVYLSKDSRLRPEMLPDMYPQLDRFRALRARVDPAGLLRSDLGLRVGLCGAAR